MSRRESSLEKFFNEEIKILGGVTIKNDPRNYKGIPDRIVFLPNHNQIHYVELKNKTHYQRSVSQKLWAERIQKSGGQYFLLDGKEEVEKYLKKLKGD